MITKRMFLTVAIIVMAAAGGVAQAGVLFSDNFNTSGQSFDVNFEYNLGRQGGTVGPLLWEEQPISIGVAPYLTSINNSSDPALPGALSLSPQWGNSGATNFVWVSPNHNFTEYDTFEISMDIDPLAPGTWADVDASDWTTLNFGASTPGRWPSGGGNDMEGTSLLFRGNGAMAVVNQNVYQGEHAFAMHDGYYHVRVTVAPNPGGTPGYSLVKTYVDNVMIYEYESLLPNGANRITLSGVTDNSHPAYHPIDNFVVSSSQLVPEPSAMLSLLTACGMGGLAVIRRRKS